jgi:SPP1 family predicted phage head-tail adaptor
VIDAGRLRHPIELQRNTQARDTYGEPIETWATYKRVRAEIIGGAGSEQVVGQRVTGRGGLVVRIRYRSPEPEIIERVKFGTRYFDINDVDNVEQRNRELILTCTEVTD